jgi:hypothetical protein
MSTYVLGGDRRELAVAHGVVRTDRLELGQVPAAELVQSRFAVEVHFPVVGTVRALGEVNDRQAVALAEADHALDANVGENKRFRRWGLVRAAQQQEQRCRGE